MIQPMKRVTYLSHIIHKTLPEMWSKNLQAIRTGSTAQSPIFNTVLDRLF